MIDYKIQIKNNICYTDLVYERFNKKLKTRLSKTQIESLVQEILLETDTSQFRKKGKNIYISNTAKNIRLTVNSFTNRLITADLLS